MFSIAVQSARGIIPVVAHKRYLAHTKNMFKKKKSDQLVM